jgi:plasmid stability protein
MQSPKTPFSAERDRDCYKKMLGFSLTNNHIGTTVQPSSLKEVNMPSITVKNIPKKLYEKLKVAASLNHRSLNNEMINCLETVLMPKRLPVADKLLRAEKIRSQISADVFDPDEIKKAIEEGRE